MQVLSPPRLRRARSVVAAEAEKLVASGKMSIDQARTAAEAAGQCLELILK
jgi:hypothetical protein